MDDCIECGFPNGTHDADCGLRAAIDESGAEVLAEERDLKHVAPSLTPAIEEAMAQWVVAAKNYEQLLEYSLGMADVLAKAGAARDAASIALRTACELRDAGIDG